jgi:hypothetical protein
VAYRYVDLPNLSITEIAKDLRVRPLVYIAFLLLDKTFYIRIILRSSSRFIKLPYYASPE